MATKKDKDVDSRLCGFCNVKEDSNNKLKPCSRCKLVAYCDTKCQASHWKNGHKALCIAVKNRKPSNIQTPPTPSSENQTMCGTCVICLDLIKSSDSCTLPCDHIFHPKCVSSLRSHVNLNTQAAAASSVCPLCRTDLPPGPEKAYTEALVILHSIANEAVLNSEQQAAAVEMIRLFTCAAEEGHIEAQFHLGGIYYKAMCGVEQNYETSFHWMSKSAEQGDASAQCNLGLVYYNGEGVKKSYEKSFHWWSKSAEQGYASAQFNVGLAYYSGKGVKKSYEKSFHWYSKSAEQGDALAQFNLGSAYYKGEGVKKNFEKSFHWMSKSAEQGHASAQYKLGSYYYNGEGVKKNLEKAKEWWLKSAKQGNANAQCFLAIAYYNGEGVEKNIEKAKEWWSKSAKQGNTEAQHLLKGLFGIIVEKYK